MKAKISFFDPYTQRGYATGEEYAALEQEHADWLMQHGLIDGDKTVLVTDDQAAAKSEITKKKSDQVTADGDASDGK